VRRQHSAAPFVLMYQLNVKIGRRQHRARLLGPFDHNDRCVVENIAKTCVQPFSRITKSIKIKVIEV